MPSWMNRLMRRAIFASMNWVGSKSSTSAAICTSKAEASNEVIRRVPVTPLRRFVQ